MSALRSISREYRIYLALWRKAYLSGKPVSIKASNFALAVAMRQGMYRAIRPFRNNTLSDAELRAAAEKFIVYLVKNEDKSKPHFLELRERATLSELELMMDSLDIDEEDLLLGDEKISDKVKALAVSDDEEPTSTPFYTRD